MTRNIICLLLLLLGEALPLCGAEKSDSLPSLPPLRPLTSSYGMEIGASRDFNTYLSPVRQTGTHAGLWASWSRAAGFNPRSFIMELDLHFAMDFNRNRQHTSSMTDVDLSLAWNLLYRMRPLTDLQIAAGAGLELDAGALYMPRNSNNPVAARLSLDLTLNLRADYTFRLGRFPLTVTDRLSLPSLGLFFSPQYGESYYEIYLGDHSGLAHCGWWGNHFALTNTLSLSIPICHIRLCPGYRFQCRSSYVNDINTRLVNHSFVLGITTDWVNVTRGSVDSRRDVITANY